METRLLRAFLALADERHFGRAARHLHLSTPALSRQIAKLEQLAGTSLFERSPIELTAAGEALLADARRTVRAAGDTEARLAELRHHRSVVLRIGVLSHGGGEAMTAAVRSFSAHHPDIGVTLHGLDFPDAASAVLDGRVDVAFVRPSLGDARLRESPLLTEPRFAILPADDERAHLADLGVDELDRDRFLAPVDGSPWAYRSFLHLLEDRNQEAPRLVDSQCRRAEEFLTAVGAGLGIATTVGSFTRHYRWPGVAYVPLRGARPASTALVSRAEDRRPMVEAVHDEVAAVAARLHTGPRRSRPAASPRPLTSPATAASRSDRPRR